MKHSSSDLCIEVLDYRILQATIRHLAEYIAGKQTSVVRIQSPIVVPNVKQKEDRAMTVNGHSHSALHSLCHRHKLEKSGRTANQ